MSKELNTEMIEKVIVKNNYVAMLSATLELGKSISPHLEKEEKMLYNRVNKKLELLIRGFNRSTSKTIVFTDMVNNYIKISDDLINEQLKMLKELEDEWVSSEDKV